MGTVKLYYLILVLDRLKIGQVIEEDYFENAVGKNEGH